MGSLANDMTRLHDEIGALRQTRSTFLELLRYSTDALRADAKDMQSRFRDQRRAMALELRDKLATHSSVLSKDVNTMLAHFASNRIETAARTRSDLGAFVDGVKQDVVELADAVKTMQDTMRGDHTEMARRLRNSLDRFVSDLQETVSQMTSDFRRDRVDMAREGRIERELFVQKIQEHAGNLKQAVGDLLAEFRTDINGAHLAWTGVSSPRSPQDDVAVNTPEKSMPPPPVQSAEPEMDDAPVETPEETDTADLTRIDGIGLAREKLLNAVGIFSLKKLAACTPGKLHAAVVEKNKFIAMEGVEKWIEQAKTLI
ncbi:MAG: DUF4332 domain-containing protein [Desulfobacterales bacterium]|nr:DUF4332 domain-containing protein [Desulfobacterales bacterium]MCF8080422.1 DUF4332 domain-containing protein [Desulfobacterales bacterium]